MNHLIFLLFLFQARPGNWLQSDKETNLGLEFDSIRLIKKDNVGTKQLCMN